MTFVTLAARAAPVGSDDALRAAALALYNAGHWNLMRHNADFTGAARAAEAKLWENLRDALGLAPGTATANGG